ncbi:MAG: hypothetical protein Ct9H90mP14_3700 [Methanobacteriota archaeon]|nr:MAG: hypothetical protein Ct9H90mP14_3700 [Euryarchaeota archaeon]
MTMEIVLAWMDEGEDPGVDQVLIVTEIITSSKYENRISRIGRPISRPFTRLVHIEKEKMLDFDPQHRESVCEVLRLR